MKRSLLRIASAIGVLCLAGTSAWATSTPTPTPQWTYNFTPVNQFVSADTPGSGTASLTNEMTKSASGNSDVVVTNLKVSSTASYSSPDTFNTNGGWQVGLQLTDLASGSAAGASTTMMFSGKFGGNFSSQSANVTNTFTGQTSYTWTAPSGNVYSVTLNGYTPPGPPTQANYGSISARVTVTPFSGGGGIPAGGNTPEPSTLLLSCLGLSFAGLTSWRKRRRSLAALLA